MSLWRWLHNIQYDSVKHCEVKAKEAGEMLANKYSNILQKIIKSVAHLSLHSNRIHFDIFKSIKYIRFILAINYYKKMQNFFYALT
jgi:exopolysaccharide biosynthesis predicted pyruvyltransferase EpsI